MIQGLKTIQRAFPWFEREWRDAPIYDLSEGMERYTNTDDTHVEFATEIDNKFWHIVIPPSLKFYITGPRKWSMEARTMLDADKKPEGVNQKIYSEFAVNARRDGDRIYIPHLLIYDHYEGVDFRVAKHYKKLLISRDIDGKIKISRTDPIQNLTELASVYGKQMNMSRFGEVSSDAEKELMLLAHRRIEKEDMSDFLTTITIGLFYLNVKNILVSSVLVPKHRPFYWPETWPKKYNHLSLGKTLGKEWPGREGVGVPTGTKYRMHFQRGHFKMRKTGVYWWNPHWRGDAKVGVKV